MDLPINNDAWEQLPAHDCSALAPGLWDPPTVDELRACIRQLSRNKSPDLNGVHAELLHALAQSGLQGPYATRAALSANSGLIGHFRTLFGNRQSVLVPIFEGKVIFKILTTTAG